MSELLSPRWSKLVRGMLASTYVYVAPFPNVYVPNFKLEDSHQRFSVFGGQKFGGLKVWRFRSAKQ